jgi:ribosomal-protein-serine acetyltransferase
VGAPGEGAAVHDVPFDRPPVARRLRPGYAPRVARSASLEEPSSGGVPSGGATSEGAKRASFRALRSDHVTLHSIREDNFAEVRAMFDGYPDSPYMLSELEANYRPEYDEQHRQTVFGFYTTVRGKLAGASLLGISSFAEARGFTGADTFVHMRGRGVAPASKPALYHLGFALLGLNRIETGCFASNVASRRSLAKTPGLAYEGTLRQYARNTAGVFEDELRFAIVRADWLAHYGKTRVDVLV